MTKGDFSVWLSKLLVLKLYNFLVCYLLHCNVILNEQNKHVGCKNEMKLKHVTFLDFKEYFQMYDLNARFMKL